MVFFIKKYKYLECLVIFLLEFDHFTFFWILSIFWHFFWAKSEPFNRLEAIEVIFIIFLKQRTKSYVDLSNYYENWMIRGLSFHIGWSLTFRICRIRLFLLFCLHPYYSRAGEDQFCSTSHCRRTRRAELQPAVNRQPGYRRGTRRAELFKFCILF